MAKSGVVGKALHNGLREDINAPMGRPHAKGLGGGEYVGYYTELLEGKRGACTAHAGLYLVQYK